VLAPVPVIGDKHDAVFGRVDGGFAHFAGLVGARVAVRVYGGPGPDDLAETGCVARAVVAEVVAVVRAVVFEGGAADGGALLGFLEVWVGVGDGGPVSVS
jgi:hypothetical protein